MKEVTQCPGCNSAGKAPYMVVPDRHYGIPGNFTYARCTSCGLIYSDPMPDNNELMAYYPEDSYYSYSIQFKPEDPAWKEWIRKILFINFKTRDPRFAKPGKMLDIGCGNGWF